MKLTITLDFRNHEPDDSTVEMELERITGMMRDGFTSGEIITDNAEGDDFRGWWTASQEDAES